MSPGRSVPHAGSVVPVAVRQRDRCHGPVRASVSGPVLADHQADADARGKEQKVDQNILS